MLSYLEGAAPYLLTGLVLYLLLRAVIWFLYYRGEMQVPVWHELGCFLLGLYLLLLFSAAVSPALGFSWKPVLKGSNFIPVKGILDLVKDSGIFFLFGKILCFLPLGFLLPFSFRRFQSFWKVLALGGGISLFIELFQLFLTPKTDIDEVILSLLGIFIGYFIFGMIRYYDPEFERMATVKRSRRKGVPVVVRKELELLVLLMLLAVLGRGTQLEVRQVKEEKAAKETQEAKEEEERKAAEAEEQKRLEEEEAKKLKTAENMLELSVEAEAACLFSIEDDELLYDKNGEERVAPASTVKLVTALTVLKYCGTDEIITAGEEISLISPSASTANLKVGTRGDVETFLTALLLPSGNDAAYVLAKYTGMKILNDESASTADAVEAFVEAMNACAAELNLEDSNFGSPDGDNADNQYTTARDMIRVARACLENETIAELCGDKSRRALFENMDVTYQNSNLLLQESSDYYYEGALGLKTGSTTDAGKCLIGAVEIGGRRYVTAVMQDSEEGRWTDTRALFDAAAAME